MTSPQDARPPYSLSNPLPPNAESAYPVQIKARDSDFAHQESVPAESGWTRLLNKFDRDGLGNLLLVGEIIVASLAIVGALVIGSSQISIMDEQNKIALKQLDITAEQNRITDKQRELSDKQNSINEKQLNLGEEQREIALKQTEILEAQAQSQATQEAFVRDREYKPSLTVAYDGRERPYEGSLVVRNYGYHEFVVKTIRVVGGTNILLGHDNRGVLVPSGAGIGMLGGTGISTSTKPFEDYLDSRTASSPDLKQFDAVRHRLEEGKISLQWPETTGSARKWWEAFELGERRSVGTRPPPR